MRNRHMFLSLIVLLLLISGGYTIYYLNNPNQAEPTTSNFKKTLEISNKDNPANNKTASFLNKTRTLLPKEQAFQFLPPVISKDKVTLSWQVAPGYYLYRHGFKILQKNGAPIEHLQLPQGKDKYDDYLGHFQVYENTVTASFSTKELKLPTIITAHYQGCAESGYCYPPMEKNINLNQTAK